jgi:hypothetical protein
MAAPAIAGTDTRPTRGVDALTVTFATLTALGPATPYCGDSARRTRE